MAGATDRVRQELAALAVVDGEVEVEVGAILRAAGSLARDADGLRLELWTTTGATARRVHLLLRHMDAAPTVLVREATNVAGRTYGVVVGSPVAAALGTRLGLLDDAGRPTAVAPDGHEAVPAALVRGALLGGGSVSGPRRAPHLELRASRRATAVQLGRALAALGVEATVTTARSGHRAVVKSGSAIADLLAALGATQAWLAHEEQLLRRQVRADAQRLANADAANVRRAVRAASDQVRLVERAVDRLGWEVLGEDLREVALARLANPSASLAELGQLCDPPVGKSAVHRRLARLTELLAEADAS